ncbi:MAG: hypothetical protein CFR70_03010 [Rhodocyclaceae bacterium]|nr:MAG: hypothetical protein CFR70_03010 [Rhodocyclaceae bacterium]
MSHELRTPLHGMLSCARLGGDRADSATPAKLREYFRLIHEPMRAASVCSIWPKWKPTGWIYLTRASFRRQAQRSRCVSMRLSWHRRLPGN